VWNGTLAIVCAHEEVDFCTEINGNFWTTVARMLHKRHGHAVHGAVYGEATLLKVTDYRAGAANQSGFAPENFIALLTLSMISSGVPFGAPRPRH
jgi:hypothetical protein